MKAIEGVQASFDQFVGRVGGLKEEVLQTAIAKAVAKEEAQRVKRDYKACAGAQAKVADAHARVAAATATCATLANGTSAQNKKVEAAQGKLDRETKSYKIAIKSAIECFEHFSKHKDVAPQWYAGLSTSHTQVLAWAAPSDADSDSDDGYGGA